MTDTVWVVRRIDQNSPLLGTRTLAVRASLDGVRKAIADDTAPGPAPHLRTTVKTWMWTTDPVDGVWFTAQEFPVDP